MSEDFPKCKLPATLPYVERLCDLAAEKSMTTDDYFARVLRDYATAATTRADARIAELERALTVRDTEIARLETDLELARRDGDRYRWLRDNPQHPNHPWFCDRTEKWHAPFEVAPALAVHVPFESLETAIDAARAGNGGEG